jgi:hypothetical protein
VEWGRVRAWAAHVYARSAAAGPGHGGAGSHNAGTGERHERGGEPDAGKMAGGLAQRNSASFKLIQKFKLT